ncbi:2-oxo acid dehydrogenase subunit E2 [Sphingobium sufflavum]|uniref:2-oxo acid dehydrogenase subunit E2 n=1 Tax=Sphingobium sufflavum TaxID=1129547 RepID=UPI001F39E04D|nr:2-oxo acid dehydrogenase subunit E2 [Sphingobium sufflavum]MCE7796366.1 2-oxo acid dehydrogenase subunit E2 [Sphingobium sufflavum]
MIQREEGQKVVAVTVAAPTPAQDVAPIIVSVPPPASDPVQVASVAAPAPWGRLEDKIKISPLAARIARTRNIDLGPSKGTGPAAGRIVRADLGITPRTTVAPVTIAAPVEAVAVVEPVADVPHEMLKLSGMRKTIARRLTQSKQQVPHIYLSVDVRIEALLPLRADINAGLAAREINVSVNDMVIKALALSLIEVPACNVQFAGDQMAQFKRADISVAVSIPNGLITPIVKGADTRSISGIASEMKDLAARARDGKLQPQEYQGGTASLSSLGMFGIKQCQAVINPPQAMIMVVGSGELRPMVTAGGSENQTILAATGNFDHRAIIGAYAARLMQAFRQFIEEPLTLVA